MINFIIKRRPKRRYNFLYLQMSTRGSMMVITMRKYKENLAPSTKQYIRERRNGNFYDITVGPINKNMIDFNYLKYLD